jgi:ribokinase
MEYDIITFGSATQDVFMSSRELKVIDSKKFITKKGLCVPLGSKMFMDSIFFAMGGTGANTAVTFALQGFKTAHFGAIGKDVSGEVVRKELSENGVSLDLLKEIDKWPTAYSVILSLPEVGRSILKKEGACHHIKEKDIPFDNLRAKWFYLGSLSSESYQIVEPIVNFAHQNKIKVAINPAGDTQLTKGLDQLRSFLNKVDILILNQEESSRLTNIDFKKEKEIFKKLDELVDGIALMTKGSEGVVVSDGKYLYSAGIPKSDLVDRTGAGDAFGSGFVSGYIEKQDIPYAVQLGTANATACLQKMGAARGLLKKGEWGPWEKVKVSKIKI